MKPETAGIYAAIIGAIIFLAGILAASESRGEVRVVDGDTVVLDGERVRIFGLDCPERRDPGGPAATAKLGEILAGKEIWIKRRGQDRYKRTVAKLFVDGRDVACLMIMAGVCREYMRYSRGEYEACNGNRR